MRRPAGLAQWLVMLAATLPACAVPPADGGGRDVSVALFSTRDLRAITVTPIGGNAWISHCAQCARKPLTTALHIAGPAEIFAGGTLRITDDASGETRTASGLWRRANGRTNV